MDIKDYINECKTFWNINDFESEILNWNFKTDYPEDKKFHIGHPIGSHKGPSIGDILPYTRLPKLIKDHFPNAYISIPNHFEPFFKFNPYIDNFNGNPERWGSLGTWGTTIQRTCNVWGLKTFKFDPILYYPSKLKSNSILFSTNSKTGGQIKNFNIFEDIIEELKRKYYCIQIGLDSDYLLKNVNEYILNLDIYSLIDIISSNKIYIGIQNSIYHLSKSLGLKVIGILPENINPKLVVLPFLTQINQLELEMLTDFERERSKRWIESLKNSDIDPYSSHHIGWLYPDVTHLTMSINETNRCPTLSVKNILLSIDNKIYPFNNPRLWDIDKYKDLWIN